LLDALPNYVLVVHKSTSRAMHYAYYAGFPCQGGSQSKAMQYEIYAILAYAL
jgi:hypothetical protein